jgi:hypothetical protein
MMQQPALQPGERVVAPSATSAFAGLATSTVVGLVIAWEARLNPLVWLVVISVAAFMGALVGRACGALLFPAKAGSVQVVRPGPGALPRMLIAAATPAAVSALLLVVLARITLSATFGLTFMLGILGIALGTALLIALAAART